MDRYDLWGPVGRVPVEVLSAPSRSRAKRWGLWDVAWVFVALLVTQLALLPVLVVVAINRDGIQTDAPGAATLLTDSVTDLLTSPGVLVVATLLQWAVFLSVPAYATYRKGAGSLVRDFGFRFAVRDLWWGPVLALGAQVGLVVVNGAVRWFTDWDLSGSDNTTQVTDHAGLLLVFMVLGASVAAPVTEEILFRGLILRAFVRSLAGVDLAEVVPGRTDRFHPSPTSPRRRRVGTVFAVVCSSALFGVLHLQADPAGTSFGAWWVVVQTGLLGAVFAVVALKTRRLGTVVIAHVVFNSTSLTVALLGG